MDPNDPGSPDGQKPQSLAQVQKLAELGLLTASVLHELKQPLLGIKGYAQLLADRGGSEAALILKQVERIEALLSTHRRFLSADGERRALDIVSLVEEALAVVSPRTKSLGVEVLFTPPQPHPKVTASEGQVLQILVNLVGNALDAVERGGKKRVQIVLRAEPGTVDVIVADDGPGIPSDVAARLFTPFFTTKGAERGTGLGLYISRTLAEKNGGALELLPSLVVGLDARTVFRLRFRTEAAAKPSSRRILVVDDEEVVRSLLGDLLRNEPVEVQFAETGDQAVALLANARFDLVVTDKNLPGASGLEVARAAQRSGRTPVMLMTGYPSLETAQEGFEAGLIDYLEKPFEDIGVVRQRIRDALTPKSVPAPKPVSRRVLVVDDRREDSLQIAEAVSMSGGLPVVATTLAEAMSRLGAEPVAGVILSLDLKDRALTPEAIRNLKQTAGAPLITLCAQPTLEQTVAAIRMGASACLPRALASPKVLSKELARLMPVGR